MTATSVLQPTIARCGVCDAVTIATATCAACGEPVCLRHTRIRVEGERRHCVCQACELDAVPTRTPTETEGAA